MIGKTISHYRILEKLGEGGMGEVYKVEDTKLERIVAIKFLPTELSKDEEAKKRFIHEAQAASALEHNNICNIHEIDQTEDDQLFVVMTCYEGETLEEKIEKRPLKIDDAIDITIQISQGLTKAHEKGIIHRDIKPSNIFITTEGIVKIIDFGLAKLSGKTVLTKEGSTLGTVNFMSPEQIKGQEVDRRTDIWSLGVVLYQMITGQLPFKGEYDQSIFYSIINEEPEPVTGLRSGVPMELERIVIKALAKNPVDRYQHVDELIVDLKHLQKSKETTTAPSQIEIPAANKSVKNKYIIFATVFIILVISFLFIKPILFDEITAADAKPIAVIAFANQTGNTSYDYLREAIPNLLITSLEQSKYLRVMTWERMNDVLKQMGKGNIGEISKELGFELCRHEGIHAIVIGSYVKAGDTFVTDVKVLDATTKELLKSVSTKGQGVQSILNTQIDELSKEIAKGVGLSKKKIESAPTQIAEVTTSSMDAYNFFLRGRDEYERFNYTEASRYLENAVSIDTNFAIAYLYLARTYGSLVELGKRKQAIVKAKTLSYKAPEKEMLAIESEYASIIERNTLRRFNILTELVKKYPSEKRFHNELGQYFQSWSRVKEAQVEYEKAIQLDPNFASPVNGLAYIYAAQNLYEKAIDALQRYAVLSPGDANPFDSMGEIYMLMGNLKASISKYKEALRIQPSFYLGYNSLAYVLALNENYPECLNYIDSLIIKGPSKGIKGNSSCWKSVYLYLAGREIESNRQIDQIEMYAKKMSDSLFFAPMYWIKAWNELNHGNIRDARTDFETFYSLKTFQNPVLNETLRAYHLANVFLRQGLIDSAASKCSEIKSNLSRLDALRGIIIMQNGILEAEILLAKGQPDEAIRVYRSTPVIKASMGVGWVMPMYSVPYIRDVVPCAFIKMGKPDSAIVEYEKLLKIDPNSKDRRLINPIYHYRLAKLSEQIGKYDKAKAEYSRFLELWKYAEKDQPALIDVKKSLLKLNSDKYKKDQTKL